MNLARIAWRLLRYRVAVMLVLFMLVGAAAHHGVGWQHAWQLVLACLALAVSYISATSVNDLADYKIDAINHQKSPGRPLVSGEASKREVWQIFGACSVIAVAIAGIIDPLAAAVMLASILINVLYSLPPVRISYRTFLAPLFLAVGYVCVPYLLGTVAVQGNLGHDDLLWVGGLYLLFVGRIMLKDFRDRKGDAKYGKPTFLLRFGKGATCAASGVLIALGGSVLGWQLHSDPWLVVLAAVFVAAIVAMLVRLYYAEPGPDEQLSIGVGAKMGNGLLITLLAALLLSNATADERAATLATWLVALPFFLNFVVFLRDPAKAAIGYKG